MNLHPLLAALLLSTTVASAASAQTAPAALSSGTTLPAAAPCPTGIPEGTRCLNGRDYLGAWYWIAVPRGWTPETGVLVVHAHGGPALGEPTLARATADLQRWSVMLRAGHAWAGSSFRQGGVEVLAAGEDTERLRQLAIAAIGQPRRTLLHGQSWGASVAARMAERYVTPDIDPHRTTPGPRPYDGVLLTSGVLAGGTRAYDLRLDLRVVYQALCHNHPKPEDSAYPLWMGLPPETRLTRVELAERVDACLGVQRKPAERSAAQQQRLSTLTRVVKLPEQEILPHLQWATWHFQDITLRKLKGRNPFGNEGVHYIGSPDDAALNRDVLRYRADPAALAELASDTDPTGRLLLPTLTLHGIDDMTAFVEMESFFRDNVTEAGAADQLVQIFTADHEHSYSSDAQYVSAVGALLDWVDKGSKPDAASLSQRCKGLPAQWQPASGCRIRVDYQPASLDSRVPPRRRAETATPGVKRP
ncbi:hypothetical protein [Sphaerotilus sp.]|uniref:hypothetical protein n=1 Tax=Sphaerotilus sp. TaxID=2093942 RepID=UPI0034E2834C